MGRKTTPWREKVMEVLSDGEWHNAEELVHQIMPMIPPGRAFRRGEAMRTRQGGPSERTRGSDRTSIMTGQRSIAREVVRAGALIEIQGSGDDRMARLRKMEVPTEAIATVRSAVRDAIDLLEGAADDPKPADIKAVLNALYDVQTTPPFARRGQNDAS